MPALRAVRLVCAAYCSQSFLPAGCRLTSKALWHIVMTNEGRGCPLKSRGLLEANIGVSTTRTIARRLDLRVLENLEEDERVVLICALGVEVHESAWNPGPRRPLRKRWKKIASPFSPLVLTQFFIAAVRLLRLTLSTTSCLVRRRLSRKCDGQSREKAILLIRPREDYVTAGIHVPW